MDVRRRIAAMALFGVQLLQGVFPAVGSVCERPIFAATSPVAEVATDAATGGTTVHHHHDAPADLTPPSASRGLTGAPMTAPEHHPHTPVACPMAMACTVVGVMSLAVAVSTVDVAVDVHRPVHVADWPVSLDIAPEPPPPRG